MPANTEVHMSPVIWNTFLELLAMPRLSFPISSLCLVSAARYLWHHAAPRNRYTHNRF